MERALELARRGEGGVEPNPMVGCVLVQNGRLIGEGWHRKFGGPHAEIHALQSCPHDIDGATAFVTLEPCSHHGKTPPCADALINSGISRVVVAHSDPNPDVSGQGIRRMRDAGIHVEVGLLQEDAAQVLAPYLKRTRTGIPWIIAKWAMTLDGKIATARGDSQWISNEHSRKIVHQLRGRVDAVMVGSRTAAQDDPLLTARPAGRRVATRIVMDSKASLSLDSQLCRTTSQFPTLIACGPMADRDALELLREAGCEIWQTENADPNQRLLELLRELGRRGMTNVMVEGGGGLLGALHDLGQIDEVQAFIGPSLLGGVEAITPIGGHGASVMAAATGIQVVSVQTLGQDIHVRGRTKRETELQT
jgi:diaminohydroxyphosphoribosylaminopyrimidine deaminase/5-amino-6-(5-phosphoribosylamino)uracil reductase